MNAYQLFQLALNALAARQAEYWALFEQDENHEYSHPYCVTQRAKLVAAYKQLHPRRKFLWVKAIAFFPELEAQFTEENTAFLNELRTNVALAEEECRKAAESLAVPIFGDLPKEEWTLIEEVSASSYSSQGYGAEKYAQQAAEQYGQKANAYGLEYEIRVTREYRGEAIINYRGRTAPYVSRTFGCFVNTTALGKEILKRKPEVELREWVRLCWKKGVNPRVYNPFLPHGYEEANGLDYFGKDLRAQAA